MTKITLYKITIDKAFMASAETGTGYSLRPWGRDTAYYAGDDDGGRLYVLPSGYRLGETVDGEEAIYDSRNQHCEVIDDESGSPCLVSAMGMRILAAA